MEKVETTTVLPTSPVRFILHISKPHALLAAGAIVCVTVGQALINSTPYIVGRFVDAVSSASTVAMQLETIQLWGAIFLASVLSMFAAWRTSGFIGMHWISKVNADGYRQLYAYMATHSHSYFSDRFAGSLSNKVSNASDGSERLIEQFLWNGYPQIIGTIVNGVLLWLVHPYISIGFFIFVFVIICINIYFVRRRRPHVVAYATAASHLRGQGVDLLTNIAATRQYVRQEDEIIRLDGAIQDRRRKDLKQWAMGEWILAFNNGAAWIFMAVVIGASYHFLSEGVVTVGIVTMTFFVLTRVGYTFVELSQIMNSFIRVYGEVEEGLAEVLLPHEIEDAPVSTALTVSDGSIVWNAVSFTFGNNRVFDEFNLQIGPRQRIGLVGPSGAGKTTFVSLLLRQHDINQGAILIDGQDISKVTQDSLRAHIAVVPQEPLLFHRTIRENIAYGKPGASLAEIEEVAKKAQAHAFITALPEGYDTLVGERGIKLSGGQKQRVAIARAMLKNAPILVLDEATSALDSESEVAIQKALRELMEGKTVVAIAHRLSTLREMDRIVVLDGGKIVEDGKHADLVERKGTYAKLWEHQAGGFLQE